MTKKIHPYKLYLKHKEALFVENEPVIHPCIEKTYHDILIDEATKKISSAIGFPSRLIRGIIEGDEYAENYFRSLNNFSYGFGSPTVLHAASNYMATVRMEEDGEEDNTLNSIYGYGVY